MKRTMAILSNTLLAGCVLLITCGSGGSSTPHNPPISLIIDQKVLVDDWFGFNTDGSTYYCLRLHGDNTGLLLTLLSDQTVHSNEIAKWRIDGGTLCCSFRNKGEDIKVARLDCAIRANQLLGTLKGIGGWEDEIYLSRSSAIVNGMLRLSNEVDAKRDK